MPKDRFVKEATTRLDLSDGDWLEVRTRLSYGQQMRMQAAGLDRHLDAPGPGGSGAPAGPRKVAVDLVAFQLARFRTYITRWSFVDPETGREAPVDEEHVLGLDADTAAEIEAV